MKKLNKKTLALLFIVVAASCNQTAFARETDANCSELLTQEYHIDENYIVDSNGYKYSHFTNGDGETVSLEEALVILNGKSVDESSISSTINVSSKAETRGVVPIEPVVEIATMNKKYIGSPLKVTPDFTGPTTITVTEARTITSSISGNFSAEAKLTIFNRVKVQAGITIAKETATVNSYSGAFPVSSGKVGAVYFKPYYVAATGYYTNTNGYKSTFTSYYPKLTDFNFADGLFYVQEY